MLYRRRNLAVNRHSPPKQSGCRHLHGILDRQYCLPDRRLDNWWQCARPRSWSASVPGSASSALPLWNGLLPIWHRISLNGWLAAFSALLLISASWLYAGWTITVPFAGAYLLFWFAYSPFIRLHQAGRFGDFSYGTYLYAFPIEQMLMQHFGGQLRPALLFLCATPPTLLCAAASWYGLERHFLQPARRKETVAHTALESVSG